MKAINFYYQLHCPTPSALTSVEENQYDSDMDVPELNPFRNTSIDLFD